MSAKINKTYKKAIAIVALVALCAILIYAGLLALGLYAENYCHNYANEAKSQQKYKLLKPSEEELKAYPGWKSSDITPYFREFHKCYKELKYLPFI